MGIAKVITATEMKEIMNNFTHPLEIIREAIQNSFDEGAKVISIDIKRISTQNGDSLEIIIEDDGKGLAPELFHKFYNLGDSTKKNNPDTIGEKGHGSKIYYNSDYVSIESWQKKKKYFSELNSPYGKLFNENELDYSDPKEIENIEGNEHGFKVVIKGYLKNNSTGYFEYFSHPSVKDHIIWFSIFGSVKPQFEEGYCHDRKVLLRTIDSSSENIQNEFKYELNKNGFEEILFGHHFYKIELTTKKQLKEIAQQNNERRWDNYFCKKLFQGEFPIEPGKNLQMLIWGEGDKLKRLYNPLIRERITAYTKNFQYKVGDRYGFWACKNYIPIQRIDDWIIGKGQYTKFHAFINFDNFSLTANRSNVTNTSPEILTKIKEKVNQVYNDVLKDASFKEWLEREEEAEKERTTEEEQNEFAKRIKNAIGNKKLKIGNQFYYEPKTEGEVAILFNGILELFGEELKLEILDYSTHKGIDFLTRENSNVSIENDSTVGYAELKLNLEQSGFNHSFKHTRKIICYDKKGLKVDDTVTDMNNIKLKVNKIETGWVLADFEGKNGHSIPILILKDFLADKKLEFE